jgi:hypothetical protein
MLPSNILWSFLKLVILLSVLHPQLVNAEEEGGDYSLAVETWNCNETVSHVDRAKIYFSSAQTVSISDLYATNSECYKCSMTLLAYGNNGSVGAFNCGLLWTAHDWTLYLVERSTGNVLTSTKHTFGDYGEYEIYGITSGDVSTISITETKEPKNSLAPLYLLFLIIFILTILAIVAPFAFEYISLNVPALYSVLGQKDDEDNERFSATMDPSSSTKQNEFYDHFNSVTRMSNSSADMRLSLYSNAQD